MLSNEFIKSCFVFKGVDEKVLERLLKANPPKIVSYKRGDTVYSSAEEKLVGFVINGKCEIRRIKPDGSKTVLNSLSKNGSFGILSVFSDEEFPTQIFALTNCEILYFTDEQMKYFVNNNLHFPRNPKKMLKIKATFFR